jgi:hypothetical protein
MEKIKILILVFLIPIVTTFGQNLKTYSGEYENGQVDKGKAVYTYYEDSKTLEYVKQGLFKYNLNVKDDYGTYSENISGNYKNGKKDGLWNYLISKTDYPSSSGSYFSGTIKLTANYTNGQPNGLWSYNCQLKHRDKTYNGWTNFVTNKPESVKASFKNGKLVGTISFINSPEYADYNNITGQFDQNGFLTGKWIFKNPENEKVLEIKNGILRSFVIREISSGQIINKEIDDQEMTLLKDDFASGKLQLNDLQNKDINVDTISAVKNDLFNSETSFNLNLFLHRYIGGDDSYFYKEFDNSLNDYNQKTGWFDNRNYGKIIMFEKKKYSSVEDMSDYQIAKRHEDQGNKVLAIRFYKKILEYNLSPKDIKVIETKIKELEN